MVAAGNRASSAGDQAGEQSASRRFLSGELVTGQQPASGTPVSSPSRWTYLYRAVDQHGQVIDVLISTLRFRHRTGVVGSRAAIRPVTPRDDHGPGTGLPAGQRRARSRSAARLRAVRQQRRRRQWPSRRSVLCDKDILSNREHQRLERRRMLHDRDRNRKFQGWTLLETGEITFQEGRAAPCTACRPDANAIAARRRV
jgi:hypothetical protein